MLIQYLGNTHISASIDVKTHLHDFYKGDHCIILHLFGAWYYIENIYNTKATKKPQAIISIILSEL